MKNLFNMDSIADDKYLRSDIITMTLPSFPKTLTDLISLYDYYLEWRIYHKITLETYPKFISKLPNTCHIIIVCDYGSVIIIDEKTGHILQSLYRKDFSEKDVRVLETGKILISYSKTLELWSPNNGFYTKTKIWINKYNFFDILHHDQYIVLATKFGTISIFSCTTDTETQFNSEIQIKSLQTLSDKKFIICYSDDDYTINNNYNDVNNDADNDDDNNDDISSRYNNCIAIFTYDIESEIITKQEYSFNRNREDGMVFSIIYPDVNRIYISGITTGIVANSYIYVFDPDKMDVIQEIIINNSIVDIVGIANNKIMFLNEGHEIEIWNLMTEEQELKYNYDVADKITYSKLPDNRIAIVDNDDYDEGARIIIYDPEISMQCEYHDISDTITATTVLKNGCFACGLSDGTIEIYR